ncbi:c-type cytochrome [bacterium]|nr:c-type cytochrome [bacterium]
MSSPFDSLHSIVLLLLCFGISEAQPANAQTNPSISVQAPTVSPSKTYDSVESPTEVKPVDFSQGPKPQWIWGPSASVNYQLRKTFQATSRTGSIRATCDNRMRLLLNGQEIASSTEWQSPVTVDLSRFLKVGENVLTAEVGNEGGVAAFLAKMVLETPDGKPQVLVSDTTWECINPAKPDQSQAIKSLGELGKSPWGNVFDSDEQLNAIERNVFSLRDGFQVELLYTVPKEEQGSWVAISFDEQGRLIASDQGDKGLWRITPPAIGSDESTRVEKLNLDITSAQGLLHAFDSLYLCVNGGPGSGLYRARDTNGDDQYDDLTKLKSLRGGGEHGPHALRLSPDGQSIYLIAGNHTEVPDDFQSSRIPTNWAEDLLLPRQWDARGHARGRLAPGGWIAITDPEGADWEMFSVGYRNPYDMDFNADGELFAYDADMEWDMGMPWYRPTRIVHATSGSEFGWRSGTGKWPTYYPDSLPPAVEIGPGSPVGVTFGYGTRFPARYQKSMYILDWTFGTMYAVHLTPDGASYTATKEEFLSRSPLPLTDAAVGPDGALYFTVGGRGTQSELYRVTYQGEESTEPVDSRDEQYRDLRHLRRQLEHLHQSQENPAAAVEFLWPHLCHPDRFIRYAARIGLENQPVDVWWNRFAAETDPQRIISAAIAIARQGNSEHQTQVLKSLNGISFATLSEQPQLELLRAYQLAFIRLGQPEVEQAQATLQKLEPHYPAATPELNLELCQLLVYLESPTVVAKTLQLLKAPRGDETVDMQNLLARNRGYGGTIAKILANQPDREKIAYAFALRNMKKHWTIPERQFYFEWLSEAAKWNGGASYRGFIENIDQEAYDNATDSERLAVESSGARQPYVAPELPKPLGPGRNWAVADVEAMTEEVMKGRDFENGERAFAAARCVLCHRFAGDGGATGPDLTQSSGRFSLKDLAEAIIEPSKIISDQYRAHVVLTDEGRVYTGRIVSETSESLILLTDPEDASKVVELSRDQIEETSPSPTSIMPQDLLKDLNRDEVLDLMAYLLSRGNPDHAAFKKKR